MKTLPNSMAYPLSTPNGRIDEGLSKREYFAALAMQGLLSCNAGTTFRLSEDAVKYADELIESLNKDK